MLHPSHERGIYGKDKFVGKIWRCSCCKKTSSIFKGSFFLGSKLRPFTTSRVAYAYLVMKMNNNEMKRAMDDAPRDHNLTDWLQFCRDVMSKMCLLNSAARRWEVLAKSSLSTKRRSGKGSITEDDQSPARLFGFLAFTTLTPNWGL